MSYKEESSNKKKVSPEQLTVLVDFLSVNRVMVHGKTKPLEAERKVIENLWEVVSYSLNSIRNGPSKTPAQWKKTFIDWKCHTKKKARDYNKSQQKTGGGSREGKKLTDNEEKLMSLISWISVQGADVQKIGLPDESHENGISTEDSVGVEIKNTEVDVPQSKRCGSPILVATKKKSNEELRTEESPPNEQARRKGKMSNLQNAAEAFETANKYMHETVQKLLGTNQGELKKKELELKEIELEVRLLEARNKTRELDLLERKLVLEEKRFLAEEEKAKKKN